MWINFANSSLSITGKGKTTCLVWAGVAVNKLASSPTEDDNEVTISSLMASSGGLVT